MQWTDVTEIAIQLSDKFKDIDPTNLRFTDLYIKVLNLEGFIDEPQRCNERVLEAIQQAWIEEVMD